MNRVLAFIALTFAFSVGARAADENYIHAFTGFTFPPKVTAFERTRITPYNEAKSDIEVDYDNNPFTVHLSAYVYPAPVPLAKHYADCKAAVIQDHPDAHFVGETPVVFDKAGVKYHGFDATYEFTDHFVGEAHQDMPLLSRVILFRRGDYFVLFRISYLESDKKAAEGEIDDFLKQFVWPPGGSDVSG